MKVVVDFGHNFLCLKDNENKNNCLTSGENKHDFALWGFFVISVTLSVD